MSQLNVFLQISLRVLLFASLVLLPACGGGGGGGGTSSSDPAGNEGNNPSDSAEKTFIDWKEQAVTLHGEVVLPETSPLAMQELTVDLYDDSTTPSSNGALQFKAPGNQIVDAYIMLPKRAEDDFPTVYLYTTILPGDTSITFSPENTAISLLMNRISQEHLLAVDDPDFVRQIIAQSGKSFIDAFVAMIEQDPYSLRISNLTNVYNPVYNSAANACRDSIISMSTPFMAVSPNRAKMYSPSLVNALPGSQLYVFPSAEQYDFSIYEDTTGFLGLDDWADLENVGGTITGKLQIENDTMMFAHLKVTDLLTNGVMAAPAVEPGVSGMLGLAFHPDIIGPQKGWNRLWWAGTGKNDVDYKSTEVTIFTPGLVGLQGQSSSDKQIGNALAFRTSATAIMTVVSSFVPAPEDGYKHWFVEMNDRGLLNAAYDKFAYGQFQAGLEVLFWTFCDGTVMEKVIKDYLAKYVANSLDSDKIFGQFATKFNLAMKQVPIAKIGLAIDLTKLLDDVATTPGLIGFSRVEFPYNLTNVGPNPLSKVPTNDPLPRITVTGRGLSDVFYGGNTYSPSIYLEAENSKGKARTITIPDNDIHPAPDGSSLWFELPRAWAEVGSDIVGPIYVNVRHRFVDEHGADELIYLELPHPEHEELFKLDFGSTVVITNVSDSEPFSGQIFDLFGQGFELPSANNLVYFTDHTGSYAQANVYSGSSTSLEVAVPEGLEFGPLTVEIELAKDGSVSNEFPLSLHPRPVLADTPDGAEFDETLKVEFMQEEGVDIFYSINNGGEKTYTGPVTIDQTSHIYPYAKVLVDGTEYKSIVSDFFYYKCGDNEILQNGECVEDTSSISWPPDSNTWVTCTADLSVEVQLAWESFETSTETVTLGPTQYKYSPAENKWWIDGNNWDTQRALVADYNSRTLSFGKVENSIFGGAVMVSDLPSESRNVFSVSGEETCGHIQLLNNAVPTGIGLYHCSGNSFVKVTCNGPILPP